MRQLLFYLFLLHSTGVAIAQEEASSSGTGFFVNKEGWAVTNAHVIEGCEYLRIKGYGPAIYVKSDATNDVAAIRVRVNRAISPVSISSSSPRLGEEVLALGFPLSGLLSDSVKITTGNVNSLAGLANDSRFLQVSVPIQPGNSGGPLAGLNGQLLGVMTSSLGKDVSDAIGYNTQNVNFAIRATVVEQFLQSNSIGYSRAVSGVKLPSIADVAARLEPSVVQVLCYGRPETDTAKKTTPPQTEREKSTASMQLIDAVGYDAIGFDYVLHRGVSYSACKDACNADRQCQALTYNKRHSVCFLKTDVKILLKNRDAVAAYPNWKSEEVFVTDFTVEANMDAPGGDYRRLRQSQFVHCFFECATDNRCRAFSYVRRTNDCWLKNKVLPLRKKHGVELGLK